jgi:hypothetical protein
MSVLSLVSLGRAVLVVVFVYYCVQSYLKFRSEQKAIVTSYLDPIGVDFPSLTVCPRTDAAIDFANVSDQKYRARVLSVVQSKE